MGLLGVTASWNDENGYLHRVNGPAMIMKDVWDENNRGGWYLKEWYFHGFLHRIGGPAREWADGSEEWFVHGRIHRLDGPARTYAPNDHIMCRRTEWYHSWFVNGNSIPESLVKEAFKTHQLNPDWRVWTDGEKLIFRFATLRY